MTQRLGIEGRPKHDPATTAYGVYRLPEIERFRRNAAVVPGAQVITEARWPGRYSPQPGGSDEVPEGCEYIGVQVSRPEDFDRVWGQK